MRKFGQNDFLDSAEYSAASEPRNTQGIFLLLHNNMEGQFPAPPESPAGLSFLKTWLVLSSILYEIPSSTIPQNDSPNLQGNLFFQIQILPHNWRKVYLIPLQIGSKPCHLGEDTSLRE